MSGQHTQGRIEAVHFHAEAHDVHTVLKDGFGQGKGVASFSTAEDARRLAACWNACEGLTTEQLEGMLPVLVHVNGADHRVAYMSAERDVARRELAAARALLREIVDDGLPFMGAIELCGIDGCAWHAKAKDFLEASDKQGEKQ